MKRNLFALVALAAVALSAPAFAQVATAPVVHRASGQDTIATPTLAVKPDGSYAAPGDATAANQTAANAKLDQIVTNTGANATAANQAASLKTAGSAFGTQGVGLFGSDGATARAVRTSTNGELQALSGGFTGAVVATPTVTAAIAYPSGNSLGGLLTFSNALRSGKTTGLVQGVNVNFKSAQSAPMDLVLFSASPTGTTITDKTPFSLAVADFDKVIGVVHLSDCTSLGTPSVCTATGLAVSVSVPSGQTLYGALVTRGTPTFTATSDVSVQLVTVQD